MTPFQAPNANAYAERFVRSIKDECLNRVIPLGERHLRRALHEFEHYHRERNHQGLGNEFILGTPARDGDGHFALTFQDGDTKLTLENCGYFLRLVTTSLLSEDYVVEL